MGGRLTSAFSRAARFEAEMEVGREGIEVLRSINDQWNLVELLCHMEFASLCRGRVPEALNPHAEVSKLADDLGHVGAALLDEWTSGAAEYLVGGSPAEWTQWLTRHLEVWAPVGPWAHLARTWLAHGRFLLADWDAARLEAASAQKEFHGSTWWGGAFPAVVFLIDAYSGAPDAADAFRLNRGHVPDPGEEAVAGDRVFALVATEALAVIGDREASASLYSVGLDTVEGGLTLWPTGLGQRFLGISAACGEQWNVAERHFQTALKQAHELPVRFEQPEVRRWYAWMLLDRNDPGDRDEAQRLLHEAIPMYDEIGMPKHKELAQGLL